MAAFECISSLKSAHIVSQKEGALLGNVSHIFVDQERREISAIGYKSRRLFGESNYVAIGNVVGCGRDVVFIEDEGKSQHLTAETKPGGREIGALLGRWVTTTDGKHLGHLSDVDFDPTTWSVAALRLSEGARLPVTKDEVTFGADEVMVDATLADKLIAAPQRQGAFPKIFSRKLSATFNETLQKTLGLSRQRRHASETTSKPTKLN